MYVHRTRSGRGPSQHAQHNNCRPKPSILRRRDLQHGTFFSAAWSRTSTHRHSSSNSLPAQSCLSSPSPLLFLPPLSLVAVSSLLCPLVSVVRLSSPSSASAVRVAACRFLAHPPPFARVANRLVVVVVAGAVLEWCECVGCGVPLRTLPVCLPLLDCSPASVAVECGVFWCLRALRACLLVVCCW